MLPTHVETLTPGSLDNEIVQNITITDPGIDDAFALLVGASLRNHVMIATYGNDATSRTFANLEALSHFAEKHRRQPGKYPFQIFAGAEGPLSGKNFGLEVKYHGNLDFIHGEGVMEGMGHTTVEISPDQRSGIIYEKVKIQKETGIHVFSFGALTELFTVLNEPALRQKVGHVTIMGGAIKEPGNVEPHLEANLRHDPIALQKILHIAKEYHIPITLVPLDITHHKDLEFTPQRCNKLLHTLHERGAHDIATFIEKLTGPGSTYFEFYTKGTGDRFTQQKPYVPRTFAGPPIHDLTSLMSKLRPELFYTARVPVKVTVEGLEAGAIGIAQYHMSPDAVIDVVMGLTDDATNSWNPWREFKK